MPIPAIICLAVLGGLFLLFLIWLILLLPFGAHKRMRDLPTHDFAHRGLHDIEIGGQAAENSMTAFRRAVEAGVGIELDVHLSSDGVLVVFHDDTLDRVTGVHGRISDRTAAELAALSLSGTTDGIPTFDEVLDLVDGRVPLLVEIKEDGFDHSVTERTVERLSRYTGEYLIESFNPFSLAVVKKMAPDIRRGLLCDHFTKNPAMRHTRFYLLQAMLFNRLASPDFLALSEEHRGFLPFRLARLARPARYIWTVRSEASRDRLRAEHYDGVIFELFPPDGKNP